MSEGVVLFFDPDSAFLGSADPNQICAALEHLVKTIRSIRKQNRKANLHITLNLNHWFVDDQIKLQNAIGREEWQLIRNMILKNPVARFFEYLGNDRVQHQGKDSLALTAAVRFQSAVISFHQGTWVKHELQGNQNNVNITVKNFSAVGHIASNANVLTTQNLPIELLSYDKEENAPPFNNHGQKVYSNGKSFITPDIDEHNASKGWKKFDMKGNRLGTYDSNLQWIKD